MELNQQAFQERRQEEARAAFGPLVQESQALRPEMIETNESALRRSLEAESALQAEVVLLRERSVQLQMRLDEQRRVFVTGVQQMMQPLHDYFTAQHLAVPFEALVPQAIEQLQSLTSTVAGLHAEAKTLRRPVDVRRVAPEIERLDAMADHLHGLEKRLGEVEQVLVMAQPRSQERDDLLPQTYDTFVMSDQRSAEIERALLDAQTRGRAFPG